MTEIDATTRPHTPVPAEDGRPTAPPPFQRDPRPPPRGLRGSSPGIVVPRLEAPVAPSLHDYEEERTIVGLGPVSEAPDEEDSGLHSANKVFELLEQQKRETDAAKADAARLASELDRARRAPVVAPAPTEARGPTISLGDAKWWFVVLTALLGSGGLSALIVKWHELDRPTASQAQVTDVKQDVKESAEDAAKRASKAEAEREAANQRSRVAAAFLCAQGLRASGLDCDALLQTIDFAPQPLHPRGPPLWHTQAKWPAIPDPPDK